MGADESKMATVAKFKELFGKIANEGSSTILYQYSTTSSAKPILTIARIPNTYTELKRYIPSSNLPVKDGDVVNGHIYFGTNTPFDDWKANFLEWTKNNGHGLFMNFVQD